MKEVDVAWLAGLYEGEGSFIIEKNNFGGTSVRCTITMSDKDIIERAARITGKPHKVREEKPRKGSKAHYKILYCHPLTGYAAVRVMNLILPYMGQRRTQRICEVLAVWNSVPRTRERRLPPICHPDRKHYAHGFCMSCYRLVKNKEQRGRYHERTY